MVIGYIGIEGGKVRRKCSLCGNECESCVMGVFSIYIAVLELAL